MLACASSLRNPVVRIVAPEQEPAGPSCSRTIFGLRSAKVLGDRAVGLWARGSRARCHIGPRGCYDATADSCVIDSRILRATALIIQLIRHGQAFNTHRPEGMSYPDNPALTATGLAEVDRLAHRCGSIPIDRVISSPMRRSIETALPIANQIGCPVEIWGQAYEFRRQPGYWSWGARELRARYPTARLLGDLGEDDWYYGEERLESAVGRADALIEWLRALARRSTLGQVAVVSHGAFTRIVLSRIWSIAFDAIEKSLILDNTSVTTLEIDGDTIKVLGLNDTAHLIATPELDPLRGVSR